MSELPYFFMPQPEVSSVTNKGKTNIYKEVKAGTFPAPVSLSPRCVRWRSDEVFAWMERQSEKRDAISSGDVGQAERRERAKLAAEKSVKSRREKKIASLDELAGQA